MKKSTAISLYIIGTTLLVAAFILGVQTLGWFRVAPTMVALNTTPITQQGQPKIGGTPVRIAVPARNIDLTIIQGSFNQQTGEWTLSDIHAHFATNTSVANNKTGSTLVYGHDTMKVFKPLEQLAVGDLAYIYTDNGYKFTYRFRSAIDVPPTDTSIFSYQGAPILTLQTCSGILSQTRHLMTFDFTEVQKI